HYDFDIPSYDFCLDMYKKTGAFVTPGDCFEEARCFRLGYACDKETLSEGLDAISAYISMVRKGE
ncbi:MAG: aminotransferase, partial [Anaerotignum sp.]|nr:aminotransferase [Anaerotignum sp.]